MSEIGAIELVFLLLLFFIIGFGLLARKLATPYPIVMVIGGLLLAFIPGIPDINLNPELIFLVVLPPLLYSAAWTTSWRDFRYNIASIFLLAFGLVAFTVIGVGVLAPGVFAGFDWRLGLVLGAIVAPTDAIAATSIARRVGLPARIVDILEGESLINDATGLLALQFALAIVESGRVPTVSTGILTLLWLITGGVGLGLLVGWLAYEAERRFDDGPIEITLSILIPYAAYLAADTIGASGILAVVTCGLFLSRRSTAFFTPIVRIQIWSFWESFTFVLNGLVFVLIGLQLTTIRHSIREYSLPAILLAGAIFSAVLILLRLVWVFPGAWAAWFLRTRFGHQHEPSPSASHSFVIGWTGMRGVVSLAAALALPEMLADGNPFPHRNLIVFLTFCIIVVTLVLQGLTLPPIIGWLGLAGASGTSCEEQEARRIVLMAAVSHLENARDHDDPSAASLYDDLARHYRQRLLSVSGDGGNQAESSSHDRYVELSLEVVRVERDTAVSLRDQGRINDEALRRIERELDLTESRFAMTDS